MAVRRVKRRYPGVDEVYEYLMIDVTYKPADGMPVRVRERSPIQTKAGALQYERDVLAALAAGTYRKEEKREIPTLMEFSTEFIDNYAEVYNRPAEVKSKEGIFRRYLLPELGHLRLDEIRVRQVEALKAKMLGEKKSPKTINNACAGVLGKCLRWAHELELITTVPKIRKLKVEPSKWDFLNFDEAPRLLEAAKKTPEWHDMIFFALRTGLRFGELSELRWDDVDLVAGKILVRRNYHDGHVGPPKNGKEREIPLSDETMSFLKEHRKRQNKNRVVVNLAEAKTEDDGRDSQETGRAPKSKLVFSQPNGKRHIHRRADVGLKRCCKRAKLRMIGWHCLRHTFASHLVMQGASLKAVQELLGHATMEMTLRYSHLSPEVRKDAVELLDEGRRRVRQGSIKAGEEKTEEAENQETPKYSKAPGFLPGLSCGVDGT
ncbi:MAG: site-specific integrase [Proteobacteria bacterium]|jgi:integrase|nr:site-specific integrase [Pseudomonadota bacterium]